MISRLVVLELRCVLQRRHAAEIDAAYERIAMADFAADISQRVLSGRTIDGPTCGRGTRARWTIVRSLTATLDALHLAIAQSAGVNVLATTDRAMARTAEALGIRTVTFG
jgi:predicted nucleic acid-binding protein